MTTIGVNTFVTRQTTYSEFTHFEGDGGFERIAELALEHFDKATPGYRDGVVLVPVPPEDFYCGVVTLKEGDRLVGRYEARREGEEPRQEVRVVRERTRRAGPRMIEQGYHPSWEAPMKGAGKEPCRHVDVVLYRRDVLEGNGEECTGCDWDIVSINGRLTDEEAPIAPMTLIANHFELDGGTPTGMSPEQFEKALRKSILYWKNKALLANE